MPSRLGGGGRESEKTNVGFVPILNFLLEWRFSPAWRLLVEGDALAAPMTSKSIILPC